MSAAKKPRSLADPFEDDDDGPTPPPGTPPTSDGVHQTDDVRHTTSDVTHQTHDNGHTTADMTRQTEGSTPPTTDEEDGHTTSDDAHQTAEAQPTTPGVSPASAPTEAVESEFVRKMTATMEQHRQERGESFSERYVKKSYYIRKTYVPRILEVVGRLQKMDRDFTLTNFVNDAIEAALIEAERALGIKPKE